MEPRTDHTTPCAPCHAIHGMEPMRLYTCPSFTPGHVMIRVRGVAGEVTVIAPRDSKGNALRAAVRLAGGAA